MQLQDLVVGTDRGRHRLRDFVLPHLDAPRDDLPRAWMAEHTAPVRILFLSSRELIPLTSLKRGPAWGLLCAVTEFVDHDRRAYRLDSAWFGRGASLKQRALDHALQLAASDPNLSDGISYPSNESVLNNYLMLQPMGAGGIAHQ